MGLKYLFKTGFETKEEAIEVINESEYEACFASFFRYFKDDLEETVSMYLLLPQKPSGFKKIVEFLNENCDYINLEIIAGTKFNDYGDVDNIDSTILKITSKFTEFIPRAISFYMIALVLRGFVPNEKIGGAMKTIPSEITWNYLALLDVTTVENHSIFSLADGYGYRIKLTEEVATNLYSTVFSTEGIEAILKAKLTKDKRLSYKIGIPTDWYFRETIFSDGSMKRFSNTGFIISTLEFLYPKILTAKITTVEKLKEALKEVK